MECWSQSLIKADEVTDAIRESVIAEDKTLESAIYLGGYANGLLGWYTFRSDSDILLIGSCYGAFLDLLLDRGKNVSVVEEDLERMAVVKARVDGNGRLSFFSGLADIEDNSFDYIIKVTDVNHDSNLKAKSDYERLLCWMKSHIRPFGKILFGAPNRLGTQYFSGFKGEKEDAAFDGISDDWSNVGRLSLSEWKHVLMSLGFDLFKVFYVYPDLLFTQMLYTDEYQPDETIVERLHTYPNNNPSGLLNEKELMRHLAANGVLNTFCNAFLFELANDSVSNVSYATVSTDRDNGHSFATMVCADGKVRKRPLFDDGKRHLQEMVDIAAEFRIHSVPLLPFTINDGFIEMDRIFNPLLSKYLIEQAIIDVNNFYRTVNMLWSYILCSSDYVDETLNVFKSRFDKNIEWGPILKNAFLEMIPANSFWNGDILFFDQEFVYHNCPAKYVLFRAVNDLYMFYPAVENAVPKSDLISRYGLETCWDAFFVIENEFQDWLRQRKVYAAYESWERMDNELLMRNRIKLSNPLV